jgi:hypothetical protein
MCPSGCWLACLRLQGKTVGIAMAHQGVLDYLIQGKPGSSKLE